MFYPKVHGERLFWISVLCVVFYNAYVDLYVLFGLFQRNSVSDSIHLRPMDQVPFPAVIINTGGPINPMGFVENSFEVVSEQELLQEGVPVVVVFLNAALRC